MNVKKFIVNGIVALSAMSAVLVSSISASAATIHTHYSVTNFYSYTPTYYGDYSSLYCGLGYTTLTATSPSYYGSHKWVRASILGENSGSFYTIASSENSGTSNPISTSTLNLTNEVARRIHKGKLYYTSSSSSSVVDDYDIRIDKG